MTSRFVCSLLLLTLISVNQAQLVKNFGNCPELNNWYINNVVKLIGPYGINSRNAYVNTRNPSKPKVPGTPGGPAQLNINRPFREPKLIESTNITDEEVQKGELENDLVAGEDFSTTNVQIKGVDEPDIIKTDGKRIFTIVGNVFSSVKVLNNGTSGRRTGKLTLPVYAYNFEMLIQDNYVLLIGLDYNYRRPVYRRFKTPTPYTEESTVVYQIYVGGTTPKLVQTLNLEGAYIKSREVEGTARLVLRFNPLNSIWLYYASGKIKPAQTEKWNREIIQYSRPGNWLPTYRLKKGKNIQKGTYANCANIYYPPNVFAGFRLLTVVTLKVNAGILTPGSSATIMSDAEKVYANKKAMYVTTSEFQFDDISDSSARWGANYKTAIHKFTLSDNGAKYEASGQVTGSLINQFAMHEFNDKFFIATTDGAAWWGNRDLTASKVTSFETNKKQRKLMKIGEVGNLGLGERIYSVRYIADTAYVVTFREVDPLYIIDISNPYNLKKTGELKIPGFSSYLHPVAKGLILGVGQEATPQGFTTGAKVSLFDVSDKTNPLEVAVWSLKGSYSEADWDHRAFLYWRKERVAIMPISVYLNNRYFTGAIILDITRNTITERGRISHFSWRFRYSPSIRRNAIIGKSNLWSMSDQFLQVNNIKKLDNVQSKVIIS